MTKADVIDAVAVEAELSRRRAGEILDLILNEIKGALQKGDRVALNPFGSFVVRARRAREGRNPKTGEKITIDYLNPHLPIDFRKNERIGVQRA